jgi:drug/metabolite transporter (DMT)-like permease
MWFWWALGSAFVSGISVTFNKRVLNRGVHSSVVSFSLFAIITIVSFPLLILSSNSKVDSTFFIAAFVSAFVFAIAKTMALKISKENNLSDFYPLAATSPVTLYLMSVLFLSEHVKLAGLFGIFLMATGVYILNFSRDNKSLLYPFKHFLSNRYSLMFMGVILLSNISAVSEKIAINHTSSQNIYYLAFWENLFLTLLIGTYVSKTNKNWVKEIKLHFTNLLIAGFLFAALYFLVMAGFKDGPISLVSAIKKLEVLFVLIISYIFFKERPGKKIYFATFIMLIAVYLIRL